MEISGIKGANEAIQHNHYCYDQRDYIGDAVKSAISQGDQLKEVIVVDDASSDGSPEVLSQYAEAIQVIEFPRNRGAPEVRNRGAASAQGEYLVFLDGDDVLLPWALASMIGSSQSGSQKLFSAGSLGLRAPFRPWWTWTSPGTSNL